MMRNTSPFAINTYSYTLTHGIEACLAHLAGQGYAHFELVAFPGHFWPAEMKAPARQRLGRQIVGSGLNVLGLSTPNLDLNLAGAAPETRAYTAAILRGLIELAGDLGVGTVLIAPGKANPLMPLPQERLVGFFRQGLDVLSPVAERAGVRLCVENIPGTILPRAGELMDALEAHGDARIGVIYDVANAVFVREDPAAGLRRVKSRLARVHLSDTALDVFRHDRIGTGIVDFRPLPSVLKEIGHAEPPTLEIITKTPDNDIRASAEALLLQGWC